MFWQHYKQPATQDYRYFLQDWYNSCLDTDTQQCMAHIQKLFRPEWRINFILQYMDPDPTFLFYGS